MFDPSKPVQTRDGRNARIVCTDKKSKTHPIIALIKTFDNYETMLGFMVDGRVTSSREEGLDLVNIPEVRYEYQNVWKNKNSVTHRTSSLNLIAEYRGSGRAGILRYIFEDDMLTAVEIVDPKEYS